ncbi:hypothetical protein CNMCM5793_006704 [Aspergillus hiratsukae]|uniref:Uncharacterized protein n=1 Tax=Aspergillus hiratsukae TaxID=1194566 RepID=A0A8H6P4P4_9EURO|nr:hypothetical protein CNMCM5793_006704 [Aspergillus hiratsukae]KAF7157751.1 hypothetical protein CNMCM6106_003734 [Aspergillus hiratsukae]
MRVIVIFSSLAAIQLVVCQSSWNGAGEHNPSTGTEISNTGDRGLSRVEGRFGEWILKRDTTTIADAVTTTSATESATSVTTASGSDATTTSESTTTSSTSTTSSTTSTTSLSFTTTTTATATAKTSSTTSSNSSSTVTSSASASTAASSTTTTATTTTSTPTTTESAELKEWNHRGAIAAIITFSILGSFFVGACIARCIHNRAKKRRIEAREQLDKESSLSMLTLTQENGKSASQLKLDRESMMFCDERSRPESVPSLSGQCRQGSVAHSSMLAEDMGRPISSWRHTPLA